MLVIILLSGLLFAYGLALPTASGGAGSASADCLGKIIYAQFSGTVCGIFVFKDIGGTVSVETLGEGISGLDVSLGSCPYHSNPRPRFLVLLFIPGFFASSAFDVG
jgi:hypothetical protein